MAAGIYKKGQGYWTRVMSAIALGLLITMAINWLWKLLAGASFGGRVEPVYIQAGASVLVLAIAGYLGYYFLGRQPRFVDFLIATEGEMKKVNWSSRREILGSTRVVIMLTLFIALLCFGLDQGFAFVFLKMGVLEG